MSIISPVKKLIGLCEKKGIIDSMLLHRIREKRNVIFHAGPTNSGKTRKAMEALIKAPSGIYCSPLRLLTKEVSDKIKSAGIDCSIMTSQERIQSMSATHYAMTLEYAANITTKVNTMIIVTFSIG